MAKTYKKQPPPRTPRKPVASVNRFVPLFILFAAILVVSLIRLNLASMPLERDEGEYAYMGQLILKGIPPFKIAWNMKLPGTYYMYALIMAVFGQTPSGIHIGVTLMNAGTMLLLFFGLRRFFNDTVALFSACAYGLLALSPKMQGFASHATHFVVFFLAAALYFLARYSEGRKILHVFLCGILLGFSLLMKQHAAAFMVYAGIVLLMLEAGSKAGAKEGGRVAAVLGRGGIFVAGCLLPYVVLVIFAKATGTFDKLWFWTVSYASRYASANTWSDGQHLLMLTLGPIWRTGWWYYLLSAAGIVVLFLPGFSRTQRVVAAGLFIFGCAAVTPGFHFRQHYMLMLLPGVTLFSGIAADGLLSRMRGMSQGLKAGIVVLLLIVIYAVTLSDDKKYYFAGSTMQLSKFLYRTNPTVEAIDIARYIKQNSTPEDQIAILGSEPEIMFYADRKSATGYIYTYNMVEDHDYNKIMQEEMISEIEKAKPLYIVFVNVKISWLTHPKAPRRIFEWADKYYRENYDVVGLVDIPPQGPSDYYWDKLTTNPKNQDNIWIFRRKG